MMNASDCPALRLENFGAAYGDKVVLTSIDLTVDATGCFVLLGPSGVGKSTLLRTLAGLSQLTPMFRTWGTVSYGGSPGLALVTQNARLVVASVFDNLVADLPSRGAMSRAEQRIYAESVLDEAGLTGAVGSIDGSLIDLSIPLQRCIALLRTAALPALLGVDEPTHGLDQSDARLVLDQIERLARKRAVFVITHVQRDARFVANRCALLAGGTIVESAPTEDFFVRPQHPLTRTFVATGSCAAPSPGAAPESLAEGARPIASPPREQVLARTSLRGFAWLEGGRLGGMPRPGLLDDVEHDLGELRALGVTHIVNLEEQRFVSDEQLAPFGIACIDAPIVDMQAPERTTMDVLANAIEGLLASGKNVAVHCRAGLGRTGTVLAALLVARGASAATALERVRRVNPRWVQSEAQVEFLSVYEKSLRP